MRTRYFEIGDDDWGMLLCWDFGQTDSDDMWAVLRAFGMSEKSAREAMAVLGKPNTGLTVTSMKDRMSAVFVSNATSDGEWFDTLLHEVKHVVEHIGEYYNVDSKSEPSAYLQGEVGRLLFPVVMGEGCG